MESITPLERTKINQLVFRLGMREIPADTNIMAWVLPTLQAVVERFEGQERRIADLEDALKAMSKDSTSGGRG